jgi:hypothetical protein
MEKKLRPLRQTLKSRLLLELVEMSEDKRSRRQMVEDCKGRHRVKNNNAIAKAARVNRPDFYQWAGRPCTDCRGEAPATSLRGVFTRLAAA